jgi:hypothetical protein
MARGDPTGWDRLRVPEWLVKIVREIGVELIDSRVHRGGHLPAKYLDREKTPDNYVVARALYVFASHRARSTKGARQQKWLALCHEIAEEAGLGPFSQDD